MTDEVKKVLKLPEVGGIWDKIAPWVLLLGALLTTVGFVLAFTLAAPVNGAEVNGFELIGGEIVTHVILLSQKIFYFHMPVAVVSLVALAFTAYYGIRFLMTKEQRFDTCARVATEISLLFIIFTMVSGEMWERFEWGVWWTWEPRLTSYFVLMLLVLGYFVLRNALDDPERRATYASVFGIIAFVDALLSLMITRLVPSSGVHPVIIRSDSPLSPDMLIPLMLVMFGMFMVAYGLYRLRFRQTRLTQRIEVIKEQLED